MMQGFGDAIEALVMFVIYAAIAAGVGFATAVVLFTLWVVGVFN